MSTLAYFVFCIVLFGTGYRLGQRNPVKPKRPKLETTVAGGSGGAGGSVWIMEVPYSGPITVGGKSLALFLILATATRADDYHLWISQPVITNGRQAGARCPFIPEALAMADDLRAAGHAVTVHNVIVEQAPGLSAIPALTVVYDGVHVPVVQGHTAAKLRAEEVTKAAVSKAQADHDAAKVSAVEAEASALRIQAGEKAVLADALRVRGSIAEADRIDAEADKLDADAAAKDAAAVELKETAAVDAMPVGP